MTRPTVRHLTPLGSTMVGIFLVEHHAKVGGFHASTFARWFAQMETAGQITIPAKCSNSGQAKTLVLDDAFFTAPQVIQ